MLEANTDGPWPREALIGGDYIAAAVDFPGEE
jgi:hypothetical protein